MQPELKVMLAELKKVAEAASPGPWEMSQEPRKSHQSGKFMHFVNGPSYISDYEDYGLVGVDARYIAAANPEVMLKLLALIEQQQVAARWREEQDNCGP